jgi:hypothetical protein
MPAMNEFKRKPGSVTRAEPMRAILAAGRHPLDKGRVSEIVDLLRMHPRRLAALVECLWDEDPGVASRAADALERLTSVRKSATGPVIAARRLEPWKEALIGLMIEAEPKKLRWNLALILPRIALTVAEARRGSAVLRSWLEDSSSIVKTAALDGLAAFTRHDPASLPQVSELLRIHSRSGTAAMRARSRILLKKLSSVDTRRSFIA